MRPWHELEAVSGRAGVYADNLPSNRALPNDETIESLIPGWTIHQPWEHRHFPIDDMTCVVCGEQMGPNDISRHVCSVAEAVGAGHGAHGYAGDARGSARH